MPNLLPLPILLPLGFAALCLVFGRSLLLQRVLSFTALGANVLVATVLLIQTNANGAVALWIGGWDGPLGISLVADRLSALMLLVSSVVSLVVLAFSIGHGFADDDDDTPVTVYFPTFLVLTAGIANAFLAGDLFNLFVGFEILLFASYVLLTLNATGQRVRAGSTYVVVSLLSSLLFLIAIAAAYGATGTVNLAQLAVRIPGLSDTVSLMLQLLLLIVFGIKAAIFPMSAWLPDSYPTAPAPVTAVFAGLLTKVGVYAIIRTQTLLFPHSQLRDLLLWVAILTMLVGIMGAVAQTGIKRMLSFTLVSHIGYMIWGVGLASEAGISGAIFYVVHHITIQAVLFLVAGLIERAGGSTMVEELGGLAVVSPVLGLLYFIPAMNLAGIPPMSGFLAKVGLIQAAVDEGDALAYGVVVAGLVTSLLTLYAISKAWNQAFWRTPTRAMINVGQRAADLDPLGAIRRQGYDVDVAEDDLDDANIGGRAMPPSMVIWTALLILAGLMVTVIAGPLYEFTDEAARDLLERSVYLKTVLPGGDLG